MPTWTQALSDAEAAETSYRSARRGSVPSYYRFDGRATVLVNDWVRARSAVSSAAPGSNQSYWLNVAIRAVTNMGPSWSVVTGQPLADLFGETLWNREMGSHQPFGFVNADGLLDGLLTDWSRNVWVASGRTVPTTAFPPQEVWSYLFANTLILAGAT